MNLAKHILILTLFLPIICLQAQELKMPPVLVINGTVYSGVSFRSIDEETVTFDHRGGTAKVKIRDLPNSLQANAKAAASASKQNPSVQPELKVFPSTNKPQERPIIASFVILSIFLLIGGFIYFIPTIVAVVEKRRNFVAIFVLNFFLGWTFLGWVIALVWACVHDRRSIAFEMEKHGDG